MLFVIANQFFLPIDRNNTFQGACNIGVMTCSTRFYDVACSVTNMPQHFFNLTNLMLLHIKFFGFILKFFISVEKKLNY